METTLLIACSCRDSSTSYVIVMFTTKISQSNALNFISICLTVVHTIGHCVNFYHISTQPIEHLRCLTKEMQFESDAKPTFAFWIFETVTGITGVVLFAFVCIIFTFAHPKIRQKAYSYFWTTHSLYIWLYVLCLLHGLARLTGVIQLLIDFI